MSSLWDIQRLTTDCTQACSFPKVLDNFKLMMYIKFQKILITGCTDMDKKHQKCPQNGFFSPFPTPQDFFSKIVFCNFCTLGALTSCKKLEKTNGWSLRYLKRGYQTNEGSNWQGWLHRTPSDNLESKIRKFLFCFFFVTATFFHKGRYEGSDLSMWQ